MTSKSSRRFVIAALTAALSLTLVTGPVRADEKPVRERVGALLPQLQSDDDGVRERAEAELFRLGDDGRREMERLSRSKDTQRAVTALRLLQSNRWSADGLRDGEQPLRRTDEEQLAEIEETLKRRFEDMRKRFEEALRDMPEIQIPHIELPEIELPTLDWSKIEFPRLRVLDLPDASVTISGVVTRDGQTIQWTREGTGKTSVTVTEGDTEPRAYAAASVQAFREKHGAIAELLDQTIPSWTGGPTIRIGGWPELHINQDPRAVTPLPPPAPVLGIGFEKSSAILRHHLGIESGVVVTRVLRDSQASALGLEPMDVVISLSGKPVKDPASIRRALREIGEAELTAEIVRRGERMTLRKRSK